METEVISPYRAASRENLLVGATRILLRLPISALCSALCLFGQAAMVDVAQAQAWPTRSIKLVVATGPGLAVDVAARVMAEGVSRSLGQQMYVENIAGASGALGTQAVARAPPD